MVCSTSCGIPDDKSDTEVAFWLIAGMSRCINLRKVSGTAQQRALEEALRGNNIQTHTCAHMHTLYVAEHVENNAHHMAASLTVAA